MVEYYIPVEDLDVGAIYEVEGRNFKKAVWDGTHFLGFREKFGHIFMDKEIHYDEDIKLGTVKPIKKIGDLVCI